MSETHSRWSGMQVSAVLVVFCVVLVGAGGVMFIEPVSAQAGNGTNTTNGTATGTPGDQLSRLNESGGAATSTNQTTPLDASSQRNQTSPGAGGANAGLTGGNTSASVNGNGSSGNGSGGGDSCGVTNPGACIPGPGELLNGFMDFIGNSIANNLKPIVDGFSDVIVGLPAPGEATDLSTWVTPENGWWPDIYETYYIFMTFAIAALLPALMMAMDTADPYRREKKLKRFGLHAAMVLLGALFIVPGSLHVFDIVATSLAPSGNEFFQSPAGAGKLGIGAVLGTGAIITQSSLVLVGIAVLLMIYVAIHILAAFWPIFWVARLAPVSSIEWVGNAGIASFYGLCFLRVLQAGMLRLLFNLSWDPVTAGAASALASVIMTIIGLLFIFVIFPQAFVKKGIPASAMLSGGSRAMKNAPERYKNSRERIGNVRQRMESVRGNSGGNGGGTRPDTSSRQVGSTGSNVQSSSHHRDTETARQVGEMRNSSRRTGVDAKQVERRRRVINDRLS